MTATDEALRLARVAAQAAADKLAKDILLVDVSDRLAITDIFVIVTGANERQVSAIVDSIEEKMREAGTKPPRREGERDGRWVLLDFVDVVVHVQHAEERVFYALDRLWKDCPAIPFVDASGDPSSAANPTLVHAPGPHDDAPGFDDGTAFGDDTASGDKVGAADEVGAGLADETLLIDDELADSETVSARTAGDADRVAGHGSAVPRTDRATDHLLIDSGELDDEVAALEPAGADLPGRAHGGEAAGGEPTGDRPGIVTLP